MVKRLDNVDKVIWVLPLLASLDVTSTLYAESLGYSLLIYEAGGVARFFVEAGLTYVYVIIYLLGICLFSYCLWYTKNKKLNSSNLLDRIVFLLLVGVACYTYMRLTVAFTINFLLPYSRTMQIPFFWITVIVYLSAAFTLALYLWQDVIRWVTQNANK